MPISTEKRRKIKTRCFYLRFMGFFLLISTWCGMHFTQKKNTENLLLSRIVEYFKADFFVLIDSNRIFVYLYRLLHKAKVWIYFKKKLVIYWNFSEFPYLEWWCMFNGCRRLLSQKSMPNTIQMYQKWSFALKKNQIEPSAHHNPA